MSLLDILVGANVMFSFHVAVMVLCASDKKTSMIANVLQLQLDFFFYKSYHLKLDENNNTS